MFTLKVCDVSDMSRFVIYLLRRLVADDIRAACQYIITIKKSIDEAKKIYTFCLPTHRHCSWKGF